MMTKLIVIAEVGKSGGDYHLAVGKVIAVSDELVNRLLEEFQGCFEVIEEETEEQDNG